MYRNNKAAIFDLLICLSVFLQPTLAVLQIVVSAVLGIDIDGTTIIRVALTAILMLSAIIVSFSRRSVLFFLTYVIVLTILLFHASVFPANVEYMISEAPRFLLSVIIPSALCLCTVKNLIVLKHATIITAWCTVFLIVIYVGAFFKGMFFFEKYNMTFSYGCLFTMLVLFYQKKTLPLIVSLIVLLIVVAIGSRGAALIFVGYIVADLFLQRSKFRWMLLIGCVVITFLVPLFSDFLDSIGITSRTLMRIGDGELMYSSGREELYPVFLNLMNENPILGIGLYGDRLYSDGTYCHNLFLELCLDFGIPIGTIIIISGFIIIVRSYLRCDYDMRRLLLLFVFYGICPLLASNSYLVDNYLAVLVGIIVLIKKNKYRFNSVSIYK